MLTYAEEHNLTLTGPVYNTFLLDEMSTIDPDQYLMRASIKIVEE
jgi:effector-binding domain-containing protein